MRSADRGIKDRAEIEAILDEAMVCRIGLSGDDGPYIVPMCFGYDGTFLYLHSAPEASKNLSGSSPVSPLAGSGGKKITMIRKNPRCCFEVDICDQVIRNEKPRHGLNCIMHHYKGGTQTFSNADIGSVTVIRIRIESMTGKKHD